MNFKKIIISVLATIMLSVPLLSVQAEESSTDSGIKAVTNFSDVLRTHDKFVAISYLQQAGIIGGYPDGSFKPDKPINRAEVLKIILKGNNIVIPEELEEVTFPDVNKNDWFAPFVMKAKTLKIVKGDDETGKFSPARQVNKAEFLKMLLGASTIKPAAPNANETVAPDVPSDAWFAPYMNYAFKVGIITKDSEGNLEPAKPLTRAEVSEMMYLLMLIKSSQDTQFLLHRAEAELAQIEVYIAANKIANAKRASELAVDLTQQAYKNMPTDKVVLGAAKLARAYDWLVDSFVYGIQKDYEKAAEFANKAINKATEAWEANNATQPIARHIKDRAREILSQVGGSEE